LTSRIFPFLSIRMYEDAGNDKDYAESYAYTSISNRCDGNIQTISIAPRNGRYEGMPAERNFKVKVLSTEAPVSVTVNGKTVGYEYLDENLSFIINIPVKDCSMEKTVTITYPDSQPALADGIVGKSRRMARSIEALKFRTGADPIDELAMMGTINQAIMYAPEKAAELSEAFMKNYSSLPEILRQQPNMKESDIEWFLNHCGWNL